MYPLLPKRAWAIGLTLVIFATDLLFSALSYFHLEVNSWRIAALASTIILASFTFAFGISWYWAPWRILWRWFPALNSWLFPDINGVWVGTTQSNWTRLSEIKAASETEKTLSVRDLEKIPLKETDIAMEIRASLFSVRITAYLPSTSGTSHSLTARPVKLSESDIRLSYIYKQTIPVAQVTDESCHSGAAEIVFDSRLIQEAEGVYWTRRNWQLGLNTAGKIVIKRDTDRFDSKRSLNSYLAGD
tara:strand:- start:332 stop:1066 length:735 start_codon:yes stop_codon:yes gene_type:complete